MNGRSDLETSLDGTKPHAELHDAERLLAVKLRSLLEDSSTSRGGSQAYITYRSCIPAVNEEKLSVIGFEVRTLLELTLFCYPIHVFFCP